MLLHILGVPKWRKNLRNALPQNPKTGSQHQFLKLMQLRCSKAINHSWSYNNKSSKVSLVKSHFKICAKNIKNSELLHFHVSSSKIMKIG